jgi:hypothetical protein
MAPTANHIVAETKEARRWRTFPAGAIALANNGFGDLLILRAGRETPEVWLHETGEVLTVVTELIEGN